MASIAAEGMPTDMSLDISTDVDNSNRLRFEVTCPENTYVGFTYGSTLSEIDTVRFVCFGSGTVEDQFGQDPALPKMDDVENYVDTTATIDTDTGIYTIVTYRQLDTGDAAEDHIFSCTE